MGPYTSLTELVDVVKKGGHADVTVFLDNDAVTFTDGENDLLSLHPSELQEQALGLLGFNVEWV